MIPANFIHQPFAWFPLLPRVAAPQGRAVYPNCPDNFSHLLYPLGLGLNSGDYE